MTKVALSVSPAGQVTLARWAVGWTNDQLVGRYQPSWVPALIISLLTKVQSCVTITQHALIKGSFANFMPLTAPPPSPAFTTVRSFSKLNSRHPSTQYCTTYKSVQTSLYVAFVTQYPHILIFLASHICTSHPREHPSSYKPITIS